MEWEMLETLLYETSQPTICTFLPRILKGNNTTIRENQEMLLSSLCAYLAELVMLDYYAATTYLPSLIASSIVLLANFILFTDRPVWNQKLQILSGNYKPAQLKDCCIIIFNCLRESTHLEPSNSYIREKYSS